MAVSIEVYNEQERLAKGSLTFQEITAFAPTKFATTGFPTHVETESQIAMFMDWTGGPNSDAIFEADFIPIRALRTKFTPDEVDLARRAADAAAAATRKLSGREMRPLSNLIGMFGLLRIIKAFKRLYQLPQISVYEIGPGNGYLGRLLAVSGERYAATDNSQAFYLWQSHLLDACAPGEFRDWAETGAPEAFASSRVQNVPWWHFLALRRDSPQVDVVVSNCNLGVMNREGLKYTVRLAKRMTERSKIGHFTYVSIGDASINPPEVVEAEIAAAGFKRAFGKLFHSFSASGASRPALETDIPLIDETGRRPLLKAAECLRATGITRATLPPDIEFSEFLGYERHVTSHPAYRDLIGG